MTDVSDRMTTKSNFMVQTERSEKDRGFVNDE